MEFIQNHRRLISVFVVLAFVSLVVSSLLSGFMY